MHRFESISIPLGAPRTANPVPDVKTVYIYDSYDINSIFPNSGMINSPSHVVGSLAQFVERQLSYPGDGLHAFEGILRKDALMKNPVYNVLGVLIRHYETVNMTASLLVGLCGKLALWDFVRKRRSTAPVPTKTWEVPYPGPSRRRLFPSWSWVDWVGNPTKHDKPNKCIMFLQPWEAWSDSRSLFQAVRQPLTHSIAMEYVDGATISWESRYQDILFPAKSKEAPRVLRIRGYTCDATLWKLRSIDCPDPKGPPSSKISGSSLGELADFWFDDGWIWSDRERSYCHLLLTWPAGSTFYPTDDSNTDLCLVADWLETDKGPSSPSPLRDEYSFRVILLCQAKDAQQKDDLEFMVLSRVKQGKGYPDGSYERVNVIARPLPRGLSPETSLEDLDPKRLDYARDYHCVMEGVVYGSDTARLISR